MSSTIKATSMHHCRWWSGTRLTLLAPTVSIRRSVRSIELVDASFMPPPGEKAVFATLPDNTYPLRLAELKGYSPGTSLDRDCRVGGPVTRSS